MSTSKKPEGYAPDLFSEHARAAQLGLAARDFLAVNPLPIHGTGGMLALLTSLAELRARAEALGFLSKEADRE